MPAPMNLITRLQAKILQQSIERECGTLDHCHNEINADHQGCQVNNRQQECTPSFELVCGGCAHPDSKESQDETQESCQRTDHGEEAQQIQEMGALGKSSHPQRSGEIRLAPQQPSSHKKEKDSRKPDPIAQEDVSHIQALLAVQGLQDLCN